MKNIYNYTLKKNNGRHGKYFVNIIIIILLHINIQIQEHNKATQSVGKLKMCLILIKIIEWFLLFFHASIQNIHHIFI